LARWIDKKIGRAHIEWVACSGNLVVLQCDVEEEREVPAPLAEWNSAVASSPLVDVKLFQAATAAGVADLRKSRSVAIFQECSLPVAPLYLMRRDDVLERVALGEIPPALESDLRALLLFPLILRIDVVAEGNSDWQNLPASAPITVLDQAKAFLLQSLPLAQSRAKRIAELAIVAHHFIPARASAWAECNLQSSRVRIDATWGHPDGLQVFPCDTAYVDEQRHLFLYRRFKDEYLDVASDGSLVRRRNGVPWDKEPALQDSDAEYIALHTLRVAQFLQKSARLMWFVRTDSRAGMPRCFPWICVVDFTEAGDPFLSGLRQTPMEPLPGTVDQARRLVLGRVRRIENEEDLTDFQRSPKDFDLGKRRVAFRPGPKLIRSKEFLERVGRTVSGQRWRLVLEGSTLAHAWYQLRATGVDVESAAEYLTKPRRRKAFGKLVRDRIPDAIKARGELMTSVVLEPSQLREALSRKLVEEALEAHSAGDLDALTEELADVFEVLRALAANTGISLEKVQEIAARKRASKGGFESGYLLVSTGGADNPTDKQHHQVPDLRSVVGEQVATVEVPLVPPLRANRSGSLRVSIGETRLKVSLSYAEGSARVRFEVDRPSPDERQLSLFDTRRTGGSGGKQ
jgi:predicted house-cleaning noncanonical NTP pyrophosphatase (MazG superfamily)